MQDNRVFARHRAVLAVALSGALAAVCVPACADDNQLESIVVTAQSRVQAEPEVPIAMQVVTARQAAELGAVNLADLNGYIPGLVVDGSQPTQPNFTLRGIGSGDFGIGTDAAVGVYVDDVYTGKTGGSLLNFNDMSSIEVLKGPQGTLFGRNTAAGAISIHANEPELATDAAATLRYGSYNTIAFNGMVNAPLSDTAAARLSVVSLNSSGWLTDQTTGEKFGGDGNWGTRAAFKWSPSNDTKLLASWEHESLDQPARAVLSLVQSPPGTIPPVPPNPATFINPLTSPLQNDAPNRETRTFDGLTVRFETPWAGMSFTSISAYRHFRSYNEQDNDGTSSSLTYLSTINAEGNSSLEQDFKLTSDNAQRFWVVGASFYHVDASQVTTVNTTSDTVNTLLNNSQGLPILSAFDQVLSAPGFGFGFPWQEKVINSNRTTSYSLYGDLAWHLSAVTNLTAGVRWTMDKKDVSWYVPPYSAPGLDALFAATPQPFGSTFGTAAANLIAALQSQACGCQVAPGPAISNVAFNSAAQVAASPVSAERSWSDLSPRLVLDHHFDSRTMGFASITRGFQSGGYDVFSPLASFEPEHMVNYEIGIKKELAERQGSFEASLFHYKFSNLQNITLVTVRNSLPVYDVTTSDESATGVDLDGRYRVARDAWLFGSAEYMTQKYDQYSFLDDITGQPVNLNGQPVGTPLLMLTFGGRVAWALASGKAEFLLQGTHQSATRCNTQLAEGFGCLNEGSAQTGIAQTKVDLRLGWSSAEHRFGVALLVNNLLNKQYLSVPGGGGESAYTLGTPYASISAPRIVSVEVKASL